MTRIKFLLAALCTAAIVALAPAAYAQCTGNAQQCPQACLNAGKSGGTAASCVAHVVGDGSSAQFLPSAVAADSLALSSSTAGQVGPPTTSGLPAAQNCAGLGYPQAAYHWSAKNAANILDERAGGLIVPQLGNIWIVWVAACSDTTGSTNITDIWTDVSEDSTVGNRTYFAQQTNGPGAQLQVITPTPSAGGLISPTGLWPDDAADVSTLPAAVASALGTSSSGGTDLHVNVGMTDIRPEDALYATDRANSKLNSSTYAGLGYVTSSANIGALISTSQGTGTSAQPVNFALGGGTDPITSIAVPPAVTVPIGAAPTVLFLNHASATYYPIDLKTGIEPNEKVSGGKYPLANLYDGTTYCGFGGSSSNAAFDLFWNGTATTTTPPTTATPINLVLREPLSGTMNTTEFNLFRTYGNAKDSQEVGINPANANNNPLNLQCAGGGGNRERAIGTGEVVTAVTGGGNSMNASGNVMGYIFTGYTNVAKMASSSYNYFTEDGADPFGPDPTTGDLQTCQGGTAPNNDGAACADDSNCTATGSGVAGTCQVSSNLAQVPPSCKGPCPAGATPGGQSFPNLRNGTYKSWSLYRWVVANDIENEYDPYGPAHLAYAANNVVDVTIADFVPFVAGYTCQGGTAPNNDGQYCYNSAHCVATGTGGVAGTCQPLGVCTGGTSAGTSCTSNSQCTGGGYCTDSLEVYRSHFQRCTSYKLSTNGTGMENTCASGAEDVPNNGATSVGDDIAGNDSVNTETGGDVGGLVIGPLTPPSTWCPVLSGTAETVSVTNGKATVTLSKGFDFAATSSGNAAKYLLNLNLAAGNTIWINGPGGFADYTISSVNTDKSLTLTTAYVGSGTKAVKEPACFELNQPGPIGIIN